MVRISFDGPEKDADTGASARNSRGVSFGLRSSAAGKMTRAGGKPIARTARKASSKYAKAVLFAVFGLVGAGMLYPLSIRPIARAIEAKSWVATPCRILQADVRSHSDRDGTTYSVYIQYRYEFNGQTYTSDRYSFMGGSSSGYRSKALVVAQYQLAANPVCYVDPAHPSQAVLKRGFHAGLLLALLPLPFLLVGVIGAVHTLRNRPPAGAASVQSWLPQQASPSATDLSVLRSSDTGRAVLTPRLSPKAKFVAILLIASIWDGILSAVLFGAIGDLRHGGVHWFEVLFMLPFIAVGLGLLAFAGYQLLSMLNPRPTLDLNRATIRLGGSARLRWSFKGRSSRIREFTVTLHGTEEATYRKGTDTCTDKNTFHEMELYRTSSPLEIAAGEVGFVVPRDTMHSFEAANNKIIWSVDIHGVIDHWPDVKESFKIAVVPARP